MKFLPNGKRPPRYPGEPPLPTRKELRAKCLFFGVHAVKSKIYKDDYPWCVEFIANPGGGDAMRGKWFRTEYEALEEYLEHCKIHGYPKG